MNCLHFALVHLLINEHVPAEFTRIMRREFDNYSPVRQDKAYVDANTNRPLFAFPVPLELHCPGMVASY